MYIWSIHIYIYVYTRGVRGLQFLGPEITSPDPHPKLPTLPQLASRTPRILRARRGRTGKPSRFFKRRVLWGPKGYAGIISSKGSWIGCYRDEVSNVTRQSLLMAEKHQPAMQQPKQLPVLSFCSHCTQTSSTMLQDTQTPALGRCDILTCQPLGDTLL